MADVPAIRHPLTPGQTLFWRGHQMAPDVPIYNMAWRFDLFLDLDPDLMMRAIGDVVEHSDILRAAFFNDHNVPSQQVASEPPALEPVLDLSAEVSVDTALGSYLQDWVQQAFDLSRGTLRSRLVKCGPEHWTWLLCQHHIACDAQSGAVVFNAVSKRYSALQANPDTPVSPLPDYFDSAAFERSCEPDSGDTHNPLTSVPYGGPALRQPASDRVTIQLDEADHNQFAAFAADPSYRLFTPDLSRFAALLTAYVAFLHRVTGDDQLTIGVPSHQRFSEADRKTPGLFVEVLPLTVSVEATDTFAVVHGRVKEALGAFLRLARPGIAHQDGRHAFHAVLNYIHASFGDFAGHPAKVEWIHSGAHDAAHALRLHVTDFDDSGRPSLAMDINRAVGRQAGTADVALHFAAMLKGMLEDPHKRIGAVDLLRDGGKPAIVESPGERADLSTSIVDLFVRQVERAPDAPAVRLDGEVLTYADLAARARAVCAELRDRGVAPGACVAIHMRRSPQCLIAMLGTMMAGAAFVPIAAHTPKERMAQILAGCGAVAVVVDDADKAEHACPSLRVGSVGSVAEAVPQGPDLEATAYVLFTSGSTGIPKGVAVAHGELSRYVQWASAEFSGNTPVDYPFFSSISFDLTITSLFVPLITGGCVVVYPDVTDPDLSVLTVFADDAVDVVKLTPSHLALVCAHATGVKRISTLVLGGENLTSRLCRQARSKLSSTLRIANEYGPTEAVVGSMVHWFDAERDTGASVQIGTASDGMTISLRDEGLNPCPIGVVGEIAIGGRLARGYVGEAEMTRTKFRADPLGLQGCMYLTGDMGRLRSDGAFEYLGREDTQIKLGGVRLETGEIEHALRAVDGVDAVHVQVGHTPPANHANNQYCQRCGLPDGYPGVQIMDSGVCNICNEFDAYRDRAQTYFKKESELAERVRAAGRARIGQYDLVMLLSGGKDSTYALYRLAELTPRILAITLENGFLSEGAKANIERVVADLGVDHRYLSTDRMNEIFVDSLKTHANVCQGCFKALYTLALRTARAEGVPMVVTGLSRGQFFETRLTPDLFRNKAPTCEQLEALVGQARRRYHAEDDAIARLMQTEDLQDGSVLDEIEILDIYRYIDVPVAEIYALLDRRGAWVRPQDTGRSTNCLINDVGIHVHKNRIGYHNYALPYSWDVRMGHKTRTQALDELNDEIDPERVQHILDEIGFDEPIKPEPALTAYVAGSNLETTALWASLESRLPREMRPKHLVVLPEMPLTANGKVDTAALPAPKAGKGGGGEFVAAESELEKRLHAILTRILQTDRISVIADFLDLGVDSLAAIELALGASDTGIALPAAAVFEHRSLRALARHAEELEQSGSAQDIASADGASLLDLDAADLAGIAKALK